MQKSLLDFTRRLIKLRRDHPVFRRPKFFQGRRIRGSEIRDVMWFTPGGAEMSDEEWNSPFVRCLGMLLSGDTIDVQTFEGEPIRDNTFLLLINAHHEPIPFVLPGQKDVAWQLLLDTASEEGFFDNPQNSVSGDDVEIKGARPMLLKLTTGSTSQARQESWKKRSSPRRKMAESRKTPRRSQRNPTHRRRRKALELFVR